MKSLQFLYPSFISFRYLYLYLHPLKGKGFRYAKEATSREL